MNARFSRVHGSATIFLLVLGVALASETIAAEADIDLLKSYVGDWRGRGTTTTANGTEPVGCKLGITDAGAQKVNYDGRCTLAGGTVSIAGTMAFIDDKNRYEAVMTTNAAFKGIAIGKRRGTGIDFDLRDRDTKTNEEIAVRAGISLAEDKITVDFTLTEVATGRVSKATVPFSK